MSEMFQGTQNAKRSLSLFASLLIGFASFGLSGCAGLVASGSSNSANSGTPAAVAPTITTQATSQAVTAGQTATFAVVASGTAPLNYQWKKGGTAISGATAASYTTPATTSADNGAQFTVAVSNAAGSVTSAAATLTVNAAAVAPTITTQPASQTVTVGQTATFTMVASGTAPLSYQWKKGGTTISGATAASYTTPATTSADNGAQFTVTVSNTAGSVTSSAATLTVNSTADTTPPSVPTKLTATAVSSSQISLSWSASTDNVGVTGYNVYRGGTKVGTSTSTSYLDNGLSPSTSYTYTVSAFDAAGNTSAQSAGASATTLASSGGGGGEFLPNNLGWGTMANTAMQPNGVGGSNDVCPGNNGTNFLGQAYSGLSFDSDCKWVIDSWSGGVYAASVRRLFIFGGAHGTQFGNELFALRMDSTSPTIERVSNPYTPYATSCTAGQPSSDNEPGSNPAQPVSRHMYDGADFIGSTNEYMMAGGGGEACELTGIWTFNVSNAVGACESTSTCNPGWVHQADSSACFANGKSAKWASDVDLVFIEMQNSTGTCEFESYNPHTHAVTRLLPASDLFDPNSAGTTCAVDPNLHYWVCMGANAFYHRSTQGIPNYSPVTHSDSSCNTMVGFSYMGFDYDGTRHQFVGYPGYGATLYIMDPTTFTCTTETYSGTTPPSTANAVGGGNQCSGAPCSLGRFRYMAPEDAFVVYPGTDSNNNLTLNAFYVRRELNTAQSRTFAQRVASASSQGALLQANSFETSVDWQPVNCPDGNPPGSVTDACGPTFDGGNGATNGPTQDSVQVSSGLKAVHFHIPAGTSNQNVAGQWQNFFVYNCAPGSGVPGCGQGALGPTAGDSSAVIHDVYYQIRFMPGTGWLTSDGGEGNKILGFKSRSAADTTCSNLGIVLQNQNFWGFPTVFTQCSPSIFDGRTSTIYVQQGDDQCPYPAFPSGSCSFLTENTWYTIYIHIGLRAWDSATPSSANFAAGSNIIEMWIAPAGQPLRKFIDAQNYPVQFANSTTDVIDGFTLYPYDTGLTSSNPSAAKDAYYDDLIIATKPICPPDGVSPDGAVCQ